MPGSGRTALDDLIHRRGSCRSFRDEAVPLADLGAVLAAGYGVDGAARLGALESSNDPFRRAAACTPSSSTCWLARSAASSRASADYAPVVAGLEQLVPHGRVAVPVRQLLFMGQPVAAQAACVAVMTVVVSEHGQVRGPWVRYLLLEAGHVGQNLGLAALERDLGTCSLGGFFDDELAALLTIDSTSRSRCTPSLWARRPAPIDTEQRAFDGQE